MRKQLTLLLILTIISAASAPIFAASSADNGVIRRTPPAPVFTDAERQAELARRRAAVAAKMADKSMLILFSAEPKLYTNDVNYVYRQENNLYYLTALKQDGITFVMYKDGSDVREYVFLPKRSYFAETWNGKMYSVEEAQRLSGIKSVIPASEQPGFLAAVAARKPYSSAAGGISIPQPNDIFLLLPMSSDDRNGIREYVREAKFNSAVSGQKVTNARPIFDDLRHIKSPYELKILQHAIDITMEAHMRSQAIAGRANWEYEVHAEVEHTFRRRNADFWGYPSIVGCGPNATTLHYVESQGKIQKGDLLLMDVGAEYDHYTADVTRTFPVNGKFSKEQAEIYQIVFDAQEAAAKATRPGATFAQISAAAAAVIKDGLFRLGLITDKNSKQHEIWYMHGLGHWLGMNVHDVGRYGRPFEPGMVFTNEPGIYIREEALDNLPNNPEMKAFAEKVRPAFEKYKNIGVRIEDDLLVTETGVEWMTKHLPRTISEVEAFIARASREVPYTASRVSVPETIFVAQIGGAVGPSPSHGATVRSGIIRVGKNTVDSLTAGHAHHHRHGE